MKPLLIILPWILSLNYCSFCQAQTNERRGLTGNNVAELVQHKKVKNVFTDPVDDTVNFKRIIDNIFRDRDGKIYILTRCAKFSKSDSLISLQYYRDQSDFLDLKTYKRMKDGYFRNKGKVYVWWGNSDGEYPVEVTGADPKSFVPFRNIAGGKDKSHVFYDGVPSDFSIIPGADPKTIKILKPTRSCWNCGDCYFKDKNNVYYGLHKIEGADPKSFSLVNEDSIDAVDKHGKYFDGKRIQ